MNGQSELTALRLKLEEIEAHMAGNRDRINGLSSENKTLASHRSECLKLIAQLTIAKPQLLPLANAANADSLTRRL